MDILYRKVFYNSVIYNHIFQYIRDFALQDIKNIDWVIQNNRWKILEYIIDNNYYLQIKDLDLLIGIVDKVDLSLFKKVFNRFKDRFVAGFSDILCHCVNNPEATLFLLELGFKHSGKCMIRAWESKNYEKVKYFLNTLGDKHIDSNINEALKVGNTEILQICLRYYKELYGDQTINIGDLYGPTNIKQYFNKACESGSVENFKLLRKTFPNEPFASNWFRLTTKNQDLLIYFFENYLNRIRNFKEYELDSIFRDYVRCAYENLRLIEKVTSLGFFFSSLDLLNISTSIGVGAFYNQDMVTFNKYQPNPHRILFSSIAISKVQDGFSSVERVMELKEKGCVFSKLCFSKAVAGDRVDIFEKFATDSLINDIEPSILLLYRCKNILAALIKRGVKLRGYGAFEASWNFEDHFDFLKELWTFNPPTIIPLTSFLMISIQQNSTKVFRYLYETFLKEKSETIDRLNLTLYNHALNQPNSDIIECMVQMKIEKSFLITLGFASSTKQVQILFPKPFTPTNTDILVNSYKNSLPNLDVFEFILSKRFINVSNEVIGKSILVAINADQVAHFIFLLDNYSVFFEHWDIEIPVLKSGNLEIFKYYITKYPSTNLDQNVLRFKQAIKFQSFDIINFMLEAIDPTLGNTLLAKDFELEESQFFFGNPGFGRPTISIDWRIKKAPLFKCLSKYMDKKSLVSLLNSLKGTLAPPEAQNRQFLESFIHYLVTNNNNLK
ncbi:hypothetical protein CYY_008560 [Polysphondylium violaceum]|uniref:Ankyrin repeat protein n=1 Tax=Polysphondylium violaceum TaxID=133409 RepID=A0A8J4PLE9_9MYCE|nr:hypothetical protein CYY_008560 [Polysphondylium violaceum]